MPMIKVIQANCRASEDIMTALMSTAVRPGAEVVLIQEPSVKKEEDKWKVKIWDGNYVYIYSSDNDRPYVLTAVRKDVVWNDYGGSRNAERVGIEIGNTRIINIYHHREKPALGQPPMGKTPAEVPSAHQDRTDWTRSH
jgi:hypothetical protein